MKEESVEFVAGHQSAEGLEPTDCTFHDPAFSITPQRPSVLGCRPNTAAAMRTNQFDPPVSQSLSQRITVGSPVIDEPPRYLRCTGLIEQWLDQRNFGGIGGVYVDCERQAVPVDQDHELAAFAALGGTNAIAPFFAAANVPSAKPSFQLISPRLSSCWISRSQAWSQTPLNDHSANRRQQVTYDGYERGRSFQRAPLRSTQRIPSRHCLESTRGRPPRGSGCGIGNKSEINDHCSSVSCGLAERTSGSILDPALTRDRSVIRGLLSFPG